MNIHRHAIFPAFSGFFDFLSVQCKFEVHFSLFFSSLIPFSYSNPMPNVSILDAKVTFLYG